MKNLKIRAKLLTSFLIIAAFCAVVGIMGVAGLVRLNNSQQTMYVYGANSDLASRLIINIAEQRVGYRDIIFAIGNTEKLNSAISSYNEKSQEYDNITAQLNERLVTAKGKEYLGAISGAYATFSAYEEQLITAAKAGRSAEAERIMAEMVPAVNAVSGEAAALSNFALQLMGDTNDTDSGVATFLIIILSILAVVSVAVAIGLGLFASRQISAPIIQMVKAAGAMAEGDISVDVSNDTRDEIGDLAQSFQGMIGGIQQQAAVLSKVADGDYTVSLPMRSEKDVMNKAIISLVDSGSRMMTELRVASSQVASGAGQIAQGAQSLASGSSEQAASIEEFSAALVETQTQTEQNASSAQQALDSTAKAGGLLAEGMQSMEKTLGAMRGIEESSQSITRVIKVIDDIAFQTNILALNAAVEAARAGQHGKGFAVVADEVRNLASKSAAAAKETAALIEGSNQRVGEGNRYVARTNENLEAVVKSAQESLELMQVIAKVSGQQFNSITEITAGIGQISQVVQANSATAEESAAAAQEMSAQADILTNIVSRFKLKDSGSYPTSARRSSTDSPYQGQASREGFALSDDKY